MRIKIEACDGSRVQELRTQGITGERGVYASARVLPLHPIPGGDGERVAVLMQMPDQYGGAPLELARLTMRPREVLEFAAALLAACPFVPFTSWDAVLAFADAPGQLWYQAPMDLHPCSVRVVRVYKNRKIRIDPMSNQADHFTADEGHLPRMLRRQEPK